MRDLEEKLNDAVPGRSGWNHQSDGSFELNRRTPRGEINYKVEPVFDQDGNIGYRAAVEIDNDDKELSYWKTGDDPVETVRSLILDTADITEKITGFNPV